MIGVRKRISPPIAAPMTTRTGASAFASVETSGPTTATTWPMIGTSAPTTVERSGPAARITGISAVPSPEATSSTAGSTEERRSAARGPRAPTSSDTAGRTASSALPRIPAKTCASSPIADAISGRTGRRMSKISESGERFCHASRRTGASAWKPVTIGERKVEISPQGICASASLTPRKPSRTLKAKLTRGWSSWTPSAHFVGSKSPERRTSMIPPRDSVKRPVYPRTFVAADSKSGWIRSRNGWTASFAPSMSEVICPKKGPMRG